MTGQPATDPDSTDSGDETDHSSLVAVLTDDLRRGLAVHRRYAVLATVLVLLSVPAGWRLQAGGRPPSTLPVPQTGNALFAQQQTLQSLLTSDTELFALLVVGAATAGAVTVVGLVTQGLFLGSFLGVSWGSLGAGYLVVAVLPHALPRVAAFALAAAVSLRFVACGLGWVFGWREQFHSSAEWRQVGVMLALAWLLLALSALIEAFVTFWLLEVLF